MITRNIIKAHIYALEKHKSQKYGDKVPYSLHLTYVVEMANKFLHYVPEEFKEAVIIACWLHDSLEDAGISYNDIVKLFGKTIADIVYSVTNELGHDRTEKAALTLPKTAKNRLGVFVKLCDKMTNTLYSKLQQSSMHIKYTKEHEAFKEALYKKGEYEDMWIALEEINKPGSIALELNQVPERENIISEK